MNKKITPETYHALKSMRFHRIYELATLAENLETKLSEARAQLQRHPNPNDQEIIKNLQNELFAIKTSADHDRQRLHDLQIKYDGALQTLHEAKREIENMKKWGNSYPRPEFVKDHPSNKKKARN